MKKSSLITKLSLFCCAITAMSNMALAQPTAATFSDIGAAPPTIGPMDLYCTNIANNRVWSHGTGGLNYYDNPQNNGVGAPGQTFTNGPFTMVVTNVAIRLGGLEHGVYPSSSTPDAYGNPGGQPWNLRLYTLSVDGNTATMVGYYQGSGTVTVDGDWVQFAGLTTTLPANTICAYSFQQASAINNWIAMGVCSNNPDYFQGASGQIAMLPLSTTINGTGGVQYDTSSPLFDGNFVIKRSSPSCPVTTQPLVSPTNEIYGGSPVTLTESASGAAPLAYQWQTDGGVGGNSTTPGSFNDILGATSSVLSNTIPPYNGSQTFVWYRCIVQNGCGPYPSAATNVIVDAPHIPIDITGSCDPNPQQNIAYVNGNVSFSATFGGTLPVTYQWLTDAGNSGVFTNIPDQTNAALYLNNVQSANAGNYKVQGSNTIGGPVNSGVGALTVIADLPAPIASQHYAYEVYTNNPLAYWRFEETTTLFTCYNEQAYDYSGNTNFATYQSGAFIPNDSMGSSGFPGFPGFEANNKCVQLYNNGDPSGNPSFLYAPAVNLNANTATFTAWINPQGQAVPVSCGIFMNRYGSDAAGFCFGVNTNNYAMAELGYTWNSNSPSTYNYHSALYPPSNQWSFVALTITPSNASLYLMYKDIGGNKIFKSVNNVSNIVEAFTNGTTWIGSDNYSAPRDLPGLLDEVAVFNKTLSDAALQNMFLTGQGGTPPCPTFGTQPTSKTVFAGQSVQLTCTASGGLPLNYQWQAGTTSSGLFTNLLDGGLGQVSGSTTPDVTIANALAADFRVVVTNTCGGSGATSTVATVTIIPVPSGVWTANYCVTNQVGFYGLYKGRGVLGTGTNWNPIPCTNNLFNACIVSNVSSVRDDGSTSFPGNNIQIVDNSAGGTYAATPDSGGLLLFSQYMQGTNDIIITNLPNGTYNFAMYGCDGSYHDNTADVFALYGVTQSGVSQTNVNTQDAIFALNDNVVLFNSIQITNNSMEIAVSATFNGIQIQAALAPTLSIVKSGANVILSWSSGTLLEATNLKGPYTATVGAAPPSFTVPASAPQKFYRLSIP